MQFTLDKGHYISVIDTDNDGMGDGTEISVSLNPLIDDTDKDSLKDGQEILTQTVSNPSFRNLDIEETEVIPTLKFVGNGDYSQKIDVEDIYYNAIFQNMNFLVGHPFDFKHEDDLQFNESTITFEISDKALQENNIVDLAIAWYNEEDGTLLPVETTYDKSTNTISANVDHYSSYLVINQKEYNYNYQAFQIATEDNNYNTEVYNNHEYSIIDKSMSWKDAMSYCSTLGGHLVIINDSNEQIFLNDLMRKYGTKNTSQTMWMI